MMKKIVVILFVLIPSIVFSQAYPHDSLVFDGGNTTLSSSEKSEFTCRIVVTSVKNAIGDTWKDTTGELCGEVTKFVTTQKGVELKDFDKLQENSHIFVGPDGYADIMIVAGEGNITFTKLRIGPSSTMQLPSLKEICDALKKKKPGPVEKTKLEKGSMLIEIMKDAEKLIKDITIVSAEFQRKYNPFFYHASRTIVKHLMTKFSIDVVQTSSDTIDVIKVYEGSVEVSLQKIGDTPGADDMAKKMEQLAQDIQEGKISPEEFQVKVMEYKEQMEKEAQKMQPVIVEAGNKCTATKNSLNVEPIEANDNRWWEQ